MRNPKYRAPKLAHYLRYDTNGEVHLFFDSKKKEEFDKRNAKRFAEKLMEKLKESAKNTRDRGK